MSKIDDQVADVLAHNAHVVADRDGRPGLDARMRSAVAAKCQTGKHVLLTGLGGMGVGSMWAEAEERYCAEALSEIWNELPVERCSAFGIDKACTSSEEIHVDTINEFLVGANGHGVVVMNPPRGPISKEQAIRLAAYLIALSGATDEEVDAMRNAVEST